MFVSIVQPAHSKRLGVEYFAQSATRAANDSFVRDVNGSRNARKLIPLAVAAVANSCTVLLPPPCKLWAPISLVKTVEPSPAAGSLERVDLSYLLQICHTYSYAIHG